MILLAVLLAQASPPPPQAVMIYGPQPPPSCGAWTSARAHREDFIANQYENWIMGLVTGFNFNGPPLAREGPDVQALFAWMDQYCTAHPLDQMITAAIALSREIHRRMH